MTFLVAFGVVFVAELGDKSQLLTLALATRYRPRALLAGLFAAAVVLMGLAVAIGAAASAALPTGPLRVAAGVAFLGFAAWQLWEAREGAVVVEEPEPRSARSEVLTSALAIGVAELGDKTMLAAATLAATRGPLATWAGAAIGMVAASSLAVALGHKLGAQLPRRSLQVLSAVLFAVFGVATLATAV